MSQKWAEWMELAHPLKDSRCVCTVLHAGVRRGADIGKKPRLYRPYFRVVEGKTVTIEPLYYGELDTTTN